MTKTKIVVLVLAGGSLVLAALGCAIDPDGKKLQAQGEQDAAESARLAAASPEMRAVRCEGRLEAIKPYSSKKYMPRCSCNGVIKGKDLQSLQCGQELPLETIHSMIRGPYLRNQNAAVPVDAIEEVRRQWRLLSPDKLVAAPDHAIKLTPSPQLAFNHRDPTPDRPGTITLK